MATSHPLHPIIRPPVEHEVPQHPVRDDRALGADEDLDRQPDGVPHSVIGMTFGFTIILSVLVAAMFIVGGALVRGAALLLVLIAIPVMVSGLNKKASRDRDSEHPSR